MVKKMFNMVGKIKQYFFELREQRRKVRLLDMGMHIGKDVQIPMSTWIDAPYCYLISIGDRTRFSPNCVILAHDATMAEHSGYGKIGKVVIGDSCSFGFGTIIMPGVTVGTGVVSAAYSVISRNIPANCVVGGNPAKPLINIDGAMSFHKSMLERVPVFSVDECCGPLREDKRNNVLTSLGNKSYGYVKVDWRKE